MAPLVGGRRGTGRAADRAVHHLAGTASASRRTQGRRSPGRAAAHDAAAAGPAAHPGDAADDDERVLFGNQAMRGVLGAGLDRKRASSVLRNPDVLWAISEAREGRSADVPFSLPVPIERHFQAYAARISARRPPPRCCCMTSQWCAKASRCAPTSSPMPATNCARRWRPCRASSRPCAVPAKDDVAAREQFLDIMAVEAPACAG